METIQNNQQNFDIEQLVNGLRKEDSRNFEISRIFTVIMWIFAPLYLIIALIVFFLKETIADQLAFLFFSLGFLAFGFLFRSLTNDYKTVDYGIPTIEMLRNAAKRYKLWQLKTYLTIVPVLLVGVAAGFSIQEHIPHPEFVTRFLIAFAGYLAVICVSFFIGYLIWRKRQKPLRDKALSLLKEIEK